MISSYVAIQTRDSVLRWFRFPESIDARRRAVIVSRRVYREYGEAFLIREPKRNGSRFVFRATHRSKR